MTCQSYVVKGQNDLLSEPCAFPPVLLLLKSFKFVDNDKKKRSHNILERYSWKRLFIHKRLQPQGFFLFSFVFLRQGFSV